MNLSAEQHASFWRAGHLTVAGVFSEAEMDAAIADAQAWVDEFLAGLDEAKRAWYVEGGNGGHPAVRKMDNPVHLRPAFRALASAPPLVAMVEQLIGPGLSACFSQIFFKPPEVGGPKPVHQDNFYFGCDAINGMVTAWLALDEATVENGCLYFGEGTQLGPVYPHVAPPDKPFDLQLMPEEAARHPMTPAPVPKGGVSFHHGNTLHQSSSNRSNRWRRACAIHYVNRETTFAAPALRYDADAVVPIG